MKAPVLTVKIDNHNQDIGRINKTLTRILTIIQNVMTEIHAPVLDALGVKVLILQKVAEVVPDSSYGVEILPQV